MPTYRRSPALTEWFGGRRANIDELMRAHAALGNAGPGAGPGRPPKAGTEQINEALVLRVATEFQGFVRDLLDLATIKIVRGCGCSPAYQAQVITAMSRGRMIDRGNPHLEAIKVDLRRLSVTDVGRKLAGANPSHATDAAGLRQLMELRNALAHDDQDALAEFAQAGVRATKQYAAGSRACAGRTARALDKVVWDHLFAAFSTDPWSP